MSKNVFKKDSDICLVPKKPTIIKNLLGNDKQTAHGPTLNSWSLGEKFASLATARNPPTIVQDVSFPCLCFLKSFLMIILMKIYNFILFHNK